MTMTMAMPHPSPMPTRAYGPSSISTFPAPSPTPSRSPKRERPISPPLTSGSHSLMHMHGPPPLGHSFSFPPTGSGASSSRFSMATDAPPHLGPPPLARLSLSISNSPPTTNLPHPHPPNPTSTISGWPGPNVPIPLSLTNPLLPIQFPSPHSRPSVSISPGDREEEVGFRSAREQSPSFFAYGRHSIYSQTHTSEFAGDQGKGQGKSYSSPYTTLAPSSHRSPPYSNTEYQHQPHYGSRPQASASVLSPPTYADNNPFNNHSLPSSYFAAPPTPYTPQEHRNSQPHLSLDPPRYHHRASVSVSTSGQTAQAGQAGKAGRKFSMSEVGVDGDDEFMAHQTRVPGTGQVGGIGTGTGGKKKTKGKMARDERDELDESPPVSPNVRAEKRRRTKKNPGNNGTAPAGESDRPATPSVGSGVGHSPGSAGTADRPSSQAGPGTGAPQQQQQQQPGGRRVSGLAPAPIKPIGFAAARENRREEVAAAANGNGEGGEGGGAGVPGLLGDAPMPSPVVMGYDYQRVDEDQIKTVRDTISIKAQQEALIAQRRRDLAASTPNTPKELTFKGWQPKDSGRMPSVVASPHMMSSGGGGSGGVGRRREKTRDKVERLSIVTAPGGDKDVVPGSKSAPMNQNLSGQQPERGEIPSGSQTGILSGLPGHHPMSNGMIDPRAAPMSNVRGSRADDGDFARQQGQGQPMTSRFYRPLESHLSAHVHGHGHSRSVTEGAPRSAARVSSRGGYDDRMPPPTASRNGHPGPSAMYTTQDSDGGSDSPPPQTSRSHHHAHPHAPPPPMSMSIQQGPPQPPMPTTGNPLTSTTGGSAPSGGGGGGGQPISARREAFLAPYNQLYDLLHQADALRYSLQDLMHRYEGAYASQLSAMHDFKGTAANANTLLSNLQQSAESLKEMVRYEVGRALPVGATGGSGTGQGVNGTPAGGGRMEVDPPVAAEGSGSGSAGTKEVNGTTTATAAMKELGGAERKELEELRERIKLLEEKLGDNKEKA